ncbi:hypothetical protein NXF25_009204 [Crotalus adamanteus]|uniref:Uncharacterized protein n=1 Tax=Crotalus adamanteus TaxID=8729 RepID=A0AAW1BQW3_CROAD
MDLCEEKRWLILKSCVSAICDANAHVFKWKIDLFALCCVHKISAKLWGYFTTAPAAPSPRSDSYLKKSSLLCCCVLLCTVNGDQWLLSPHLYEEMVLLLACKKQGKHLKSQNSVQIWDFVDFEELEFLNFKFLIYFVHLTCLALVLVLI